MILGHLLTFSAALSHDIWKNEIKKECANSLCLPNTVLRPFCLFVVVGIPNVQELTSERSEKGPGRYMDGTLKVSRVT